MLLLASTSSVAGTSLAPTTIVDDATEFTSSASTIVNAATNFTSSASTTAPDSTMSPTKSTDTSESSTSAFSSQCSSTPINGCANNKYIIGQSSAGCDKEGSSKSIISTPTMTETTTSSTTTFASVGATAAFADDTFYRLSNQYLSARYSLAIENDKGNLSRKLNMAITGDDGGQFWQIKRIPDADDRFWFACRFLGKDVRLFLDPADRIHPLMAAADDTALGQQWNIKSVGDGTWGISNVSRNWGISNVLGDSGPQLSTYSDTHGLFMDNEDETGTVWSITKVRKITVADDFI